MSMNLVQEELSLIVDLGGAEATAKLFEGSIACALPPEGDHNTSPPVLT